MFIACRYRIFVFEVFLRCTTSCLFRVPSRPTFQPVESRSHDEITLRITFIVIVVVIVIPLHSFQNSVEFHRLRVRPNVFFVYNSYACMRGEQWCVSSEDIDRSEWRAKRVAGMEREREREQHRCGSHSAKRGEYKEHDGGWCTDGNRRHESGKTANK